MQKIIRAGLKYIANSDYRFLINAHFGMYDFLPDEVFIQRMWRAKMDYPLDLNHPTTFNEKLQWLKLYDRRPEYTMMVDKVAVKDYVAGIIGRDHIIPTLGVWEDPDEIDFDALPNQFVLKCNHNSGLGMCICKDKSKLDIKKVKTQLRKGLKQNYWLGGREWPYKNVPRKILAEQYMVDDSGVELKDYKIFNFSGEPKFIQVDFNRFTDHKKNLYLPAWERINVEFNYPSDSSVAIKQPDKLDEMLDLAKKLSEGQTFLRTDFYSVEGKIFFGELTFFPASGFGKFHPESFDYMAGDWMDINIPGGG